MLSSSEMLYAYMDGMLSESEETLLFSYLAGDESLREEMRAAMFVRQSVQATTASRMPSPELNAAVFATLGITSPVTPQLTEVHSLGGSPQRVSRLTVGIWSGLLSAALTILLLKSVFAPSVPEEQSLVNADRAVQAERNMMPTPVAIIPQVHHDYHDDVARGHATVAPTHTASIATSAIPFMAEEAQEGYSAKTQSDETVTTTDKRERDVELLDVVPKAVERTQSIETTNPYNAISLQFRTNAAAMTMITPNRNAEQSERKILLQLRSITTLLKSQKQIAVPEADGGLGNIAIALSYNVGNSWYAGAEVGKETFPIFVEQTGESFHKVNSLVWGGLFAEKEIVWIAEYPAMTLTLKGVVGGTEVGPVGKFAAGVRWKPDERVLLSVSAETSGFVYNDKTTWHIAPKLGLSYGVSVFF